ncbi:hypothetical protein JTE90_016830 [Oedothorax gibbosus]|uniref:Uncharacterized protein n=1 Tax=Oedothorax gibbosus TaxID=931172 RepID=A0AAV6VZ94_9ARAC|nr:hypothetical protein JTE90_016830 [Oedothorax gibbosus]
MFDSVTTVVDTVQTRSQSRKRRLVLTDDEANVSLPKRKRRKMSNKRKLFAVESLSSPRPKRHTRSISGEIKSGRGTSNPIASPQISVSCNVESPSSSRQKHNTRSISGEIKSGRGTSHHIASPQISVSCKVESLSSPRPKRHTRSISGEIKSGRGTSSPIASPQNSVSCKEPPKVSTTRPRPACLICSSFSKQPERVESPSSSRHKGHTRSISGEIKSSRRTSNQKASPQISVSCKESLKVSTIQPRPARRTSISFSKQTERVKSPSSPRPNHHTRSISGEIKSGRGTSHHIASPQISVSCKASSKMSTQPRPARRLSSSFSKQPERESPKVSTIQPRPRRSHSSFRKQPERVESPSSPRPKRHTRSISEEIKSGRGTSNPKASPQISVSCKVLRAPPDNQVSGERSLLRGRRSRRDGTGNRETTRPRNVQSWPAGRSPPSRRISPRTLRSSPARAATHHDEQPHVLHAPPDNQVSGEQSLLRGRRSRRGGTGDRETTRRRNINEQAARPAGRGTPSRRISPRTFPARAATHHDKRPRVLPAQPHNQVSEKRSLWRGKGRTRRVGSGDHKTTRRRNVNEQEARPAGRGASLRRISVRTFPARAPTHHDERPHENLLQAENSKQLEQDADNPNQDKVQVYSNLPPEDESNLNEAISDNCNSLISINPKLRRFNWFYPDIWENPEPKSKYLRKRDLVTKHKESELTAHVELNKIFCESDLSDLEIVFPDCVKSCSDNPEDNTRVVVTTVEPPTIELPALSSEGIKLSKFLDYNKINEANSSGLGYSNLESSLHVKKEICNKFFELCSKAGLHEAQFADDSNKLNATSKIVPLLVCKTSKNSDEQNNYLPNLDSVTFVKPSREEFLLRHFSKQRLFDPTNTQQIHDSHKKVDEANLQECARVFPAKYKTGEFPPKPTTKVLSQTPQEAETLCNHTVSGSSQAHQLTVERRCSLMSKNFYCASECSYLRPELMSAEILDKPSSGESWHVNHIANIYLKDTKSRVGIEKFYNFSCMYPKYRKYMEPVEVYEDSDEDVEDNLSLSQQKNEVFSYETNDSKVSYCQGKKVKILSCKPESKKSRILFKHKNTSYRKDVPGPSNAKIVSKLRKAKASLYTKSLAKSKLSQAISRSILCKKKQVASSSSKFKGKKVVVLSRCKNISSSKGLSRPINSSQTSHSNSLSEPTNLISSPQPMTVEALLVPTTEALAQPGQVETRKTCKRKRDNSFSNQSNEEEAQPAQVDSFKAKKCKKSTALSSQSKNLSQTEIISKTQPVFIDILNDVSNEDMQKSEQILQNETLLTKEDENDRNHVLEITKCLMEKIAIAGLLKSNLQGTVLTKDQEDEIIQNIFLAFKNEQIKTEVVEVIDNDDDCIILEHLPGPSSTKLVSTDDTLPVEDCIILENLPGPSNTQLASTDNTLPVPKDVQTLFKSKHDEMSPGSSVLPDLPLPVQTKMLQDHANAQEMLQSEKDPISIISSIQLTSDKILNVSETLPKTSNIHIHCEPNQVGTFPGTRPNLVGVLCKFLNGEDASVPGTLRNLLSDANSQLSSDISNDSAGLLNVNMQQINENKNILTKEQEDNIKEELFLALKKEQERRKAIEIVDKFIESTIASPFYLIIQRIKQNEELLTKEQEKEIVQNIFSAFKKEQIKRKVMEVMGQNEDCKNFKILPTSLNAQPMYTGDMLSVSTNVPVLIKTEHNRLLSSSSDVPAFFYSTEALHESPNISHLPASKQTEMLQNSANPGKTAPQVHEPKNNVSPNLLTQTEVLHESPNVPRLPTSEPNEMFQNCANPGKTAPQVPEPQTNISSNILTQAESLDVLKTLPEDTSVEDKVAEPMQVDTFPNAQPALVEVLHASEPGMYRSLFIDNTCQPSSDFPIDNAGPSNINKQQIKEHETLLTKEHKKEQERRKAIEIVDKFIESTIASPFYLIIQRIKQNEELLTKEQEKEIVQNISSAFKKEQIKRKVMEVMGQNEDCKNFKILPTSLNAQMLQNSANPGKTAPQVHEPQNNVSSNILTQAESLDVLKTLPEDTSVEDKVAEPMQVDTFPNAQPALVEVLHASEPGMYRSLFIDNTCQPSSDFPIDNAGPSNINKQQIKEHETLLTKEHKKEQERRKAIEIVDKFIESTIASPFYLIVQRIKQNEELLTKEQEKEIVQNISSAFKKEQIKRKVIEVMGQNEDCKNFKILPTSLNAQMLQNSANPGKTTPQVHEPQNNVSSNILTQAESLDVLITLPEDTSVEDKVAEPMQVDTFPNAQPALVEVLCKFLNGEDASEPGMYRSLFIDNTCPPPSDFQIDNAGPSNINEQQIKEHETLLTKEQEDKVKQALFLALKEEQEKRKAMEIINNFIKTITNMKFPPKK